MLREVGQLLVGASCPLLVIHICLKGTLIGYVVLVQSEGEEGGKSAPSKVGFPGGRSDLIAPSIIAPQGAIIEGTKISHLKVG